VYVKRCRAAKVEENGGAGTNTSYQLPRGSDCSLLGTHLLVGSVKAGTSVLNLKFAGLQIGSMIADSPDFGEDWSWVDALPRWG
jgi:hypothetical protein